MARNNYNSMDETMPLKGARPPMERKASRRIPLTDGAKRAQRKLQLACVCSLLFMCAEVVGGFLAGSLAIMTDAAHLLSDVAGFCISLFAIWVSTLPASNRLSFGFQRAEVIGAVTSVLVIWVLTGVLVYAAVERLMECLEPNPKEHVNGKLMFIVACIGLFVNLILMQILGHGHSHGGGASQSKKKLENLNIQAAYIHALGDFIQSVGVCIAGGLIWYKPEWQIADPIATFIFSVLVLGTTIGIVRDSIHVLMEGTPDGIHADEIEQGLRRCSSVVAVHDLHIWSLSAGLPSLSVHLVSDDAETALHAAQRYLMSKGITHTTIQIEKTATLYPRDCNSDLKCGQDSPQNSD
ncbi:Cation Diffusion Facilitator (CDF) Family [Phytophthora nicotianae]|uniref:Cation Diffusion Facilitator (CDF) Family n=1 Tax=Phytophthora nicotianae TaxID=4792 RepID=A0A0W8CIS8_PHYNI|nr:Cation Diffusion Facilitator (CDF) Family [Phytophthora nicotianae]